MTAVLDVPATGSKWFYNTTVTSSDQGTLTLFSGVPSGTRVYDLWVDVTTIGESGTHTITATILTDETTDQVLFTALSLTVAGRVDLGEASHAAPGGIKVGNSTSADIIMPITVSVVGTIVTEAIFNVGILLQREVFPKTSIT